MYEHSLSPPPPPQSPAFLPAKPSRSPKPSPLCISSPSFPSSSLSSSHSPVLPYNPSILLPSRNEPLLLLSSKNSLTFSTLLLGKALYRALLAQCPRVALPADLPSQGRVNPMKHFVRKQFRRHAFETSAGRVVGALKAGYASEELLRTAADGNPASISQIHALLWQLHHEREAARAVCQKPPPRGHTRPRVWPHPDAAKVLEVRPLPKDKLTGRRGVPTLSASGGVPFLRLGAKPQSAFLGRVLRDQMEKKARAYQTVLEMEELVELGRSENEFGGIVREQVREELEDAAADAGARGKDVEGMREWLDREGRGAEEDWTQDTRLVKGRILADAIADQKKWLEMGVKMQGIAEAEKELWLKEREEKRAAKWLAKLAKKQEGKSEPADTRG